MDPRAPEKKERLLNALNEGMVMVHLDARRPGVVVPAQLRGEAHLRLNLSYRFDPPDLSVNDWGVRQTLSFGGSRFSVAIPWSALFAITSHVSKEFWMFLEDLPPELLQTGAPAQPAESPKPDRAAGRPRLRTVPGPEALESAPPAAPAPASAAAPIDGRGGGSGVDEGPSEPSAPASDSGAEEGAPRDPPRPPGRPHLRVVK